MTTELNATPKADTLKYPCGLGRAEAMAGTLYRTTLFALYQTTLLLGVLMLPVALAVRQVGLTLPIGRMIERLGDAYHSTASSAAASTER